VTYDFTGQVTGDMFGTGITIGEAVSGTLTFMYNAADTTSGTVGSTTSSWSVSSAGVPYNPVFASNITIGGNHAYSSSLSAPNNDPDDSSAVTGSNGSSFTANEATPAFDLNSFFNIVGTTATLGSPYNGSGLPLPFTSGENANGGFTIGVVSIDYGINTLTLAVPNPASGALMLAGLGVIGVFMRRRSCGVAAV
jgi:hypothetical protein